MAKIVIANLKMNFLLSEIKPYLSKLKEVNPSNLVLCPPFIYMPYFLGFNLGAQNCFYENKGAYTGETSPLQLKKMTVEYVLVGHSERRKYFGEEGELLVKKIQAALANNLKVVFCVGENKVARESGETFSVILKQLKDVLTVIPKENFDNISIAYEPIWSIGSGKVPSNEDIEKVVCYIKEVVADLKQRECLILYGGSVNKGNVQRLLQISQLDGFLAATASLDADELLEVCKMAADGNV